MIKNSNNRKKKIVVDEQISSDTLTGGSPEDNKLPLRKKEISFESFRKGRLSKIADFLFGIMGF